MNVEEILRSAGPDPTADLRVSPERIAAAWKTGRRRRGRRMRRAVSGVLAVVLIGVGITVGVGLPLDRGTPSVLAAGPTGSPQLEFNECATVSAGVRCPDPELAAVGLARVLPQYPHRTMDRIGLASESGRTVLERTIQVDNVAPATIKHVHGTGVELTVIIARVGAFPVDADKTGRVAGYRVIKTLLVRGERATLLQVGKGMSELRLNLGGFAIQVSAEQGPGHVGIHPDVPPEDFIGIIGLLELP